MTTPPPLDPDAYRRGWTDSANGAPARVPDEYERDEDIDGYVWGWVDYVISGIGKDKDDGWNVFVGKTENDVLQLCQERGYQVEEMQ